MTGSPNSPAPFDRDELLELASLDALGLLDEYESAMFTRCFHNAPIALQREILDIQASIASDPTLLPEVAPPAGLADRVVAKVAQAIVHDDTHAPLAMIGPATDLRRAAPVRSTVRFFTASGAWRAASFLLIGALIVSIFFNLRMIREVRDIGAAAQSLRMNRDLEKQIGRDVLAVWADPSTVTRSLSGTGSLAAIIVSDTDEAYFVGFDLPRESLTLVGRNRDGQIVRASLRPTDVACAVALEGVTQASLASFKWELQREDGSVIAIA